MNTQNVNVKTATKESNERWGKSVLTSLETLQMKASKALFVFQRQPDKDALFISASQLYAELINEMVGVPAVEEIQQRVDELAEFLQVMLQLSGRESEQNASRTPKIPEYRQSIIDGEKRLQFIPAFFCTPLADNMAADWLRQYSNYDGGFWNYWVIPQGIGGSVEPNRIIFTTSRTGYIAPEGEQRYHLIIPGNYFDAEVSADAAGIVATLMILNRLSCQVSDMGPEYVRICRRLVSRQDALKDYLSIIQHPERHLIWRAID
ncbi:hypothetical protein KAM260_54620 (plasmid) [Klebsiella pneumoniae]|nr:hypothetical protein KAM260_54620 [Klebsiella pneumoniae]